MPLAHGHTEPRQGIPTNIEPHAATRVPSKADTEWAETFGHLLRKFNNAEEGINPPRAARGAIDRLLDLAGRILCHKDGSVPHQSVHDGPP